MYPRIVFVEWHRQVSGQVLGSALRFCLERMPRHFKQVGGKGGRGKRKAKSGKRKRSLTPLPLVGLFRLFGCSRESGGNAEINTYLPGLGVGWLAVAFDGMAALGQGRGKQRLLDGLKEFVRVGSIQIKPADAAAELVAVKLSGFGGFNGFVEF